MNGKRWIPMFTKLKLNNTKTLQIWSIRMTASVRLLKPGFQLEHMLQSHEDVTWLAITAPSHPGSPTQ